MILFCFKNNSLKMIYFPSLGGAGGTLPAYCSGNLRGRQIFRVYPDAIPAMERKELNHPAAIALDCRSRQAPANSDIDESIKQLPETEHLPNIAQYFGASTTF
jgi:hypothetical protein